MSVAVDYPIQSRGGPPVLAEPPVPAARILPPLTPAQRESATKTIRAYLVGPYRWRDKEAFALNLPLFTYETERVHPDRLPDLCADVSVRGKGGHGDPTGMAAVYNIEGRPWPLIQYPVNRIIRWAEVDRAVKALPTHLSLPLYESVMLGHGDYWVSQKLLCSRSTVNRAVHAALSALGAMFYGVERWGEDADGVDR